MAALARNPDARRVDSRVSVAGDPRELAHRLAASLGRAREPALALARGSRLNDFDAFVLLPEVLNCLVRVEVKDGLAGRLPAALVEEEDRRGVAQVADRGQPLHIASLDRLELN